MGRLRVSEVLDGPADVAGDFGERLVLVGPERHGLPVGRGGQQLAERGGMPAVDRPEDDGDDPGLPPLVPLKGPLHLDVVAVF